MARNFVAELPQMKFDDDGGGKTQRVSGSCRRRQLLLGQRA